MHLSPGPPVYVFTLFTMKACRTQSVLCVLSDVVEYNTETLRMLSGKFWSEITNITHVGTIFAESRISHFPDVLRQRFGRRGRFLLSLWKTSEKTDRNLDAQCTVPKGRAGGRRRSHCQCSECFWHIRRHMDHRGRPFLNSGRTTGRLILSTICLIMQTSSHVQLPQRAEPECTLAHIQDKQAVNGPQQFGSGTLSMRPLLCNF